MQINVSNKQDGNIENLHADVMRVKRLRAFAVSIALLCLFVPSSYAHPGRTDSAGGHTDKSTGEYHYHHGYPAHQHYDMDGDGVPDCPYEFKVKVRSSSSAPTSARPSVTTPLATAPRTTFPKITTPKETTPKATTPQATAAPTKATVPTAKTVYPNDYTLAVSLSWIFFILSLVFIYLSCKKSGKISELSERCSAESANSSKQAAISANLQREKERLQELNAEAHAEIGNLSTWCQGLMEQLKTLSDIAEEMNGDPEEKVSLAMALKIKEQAKQIEGLNNELQAHRKREAVPKEVFFAEDGMPVLLKSVSKPWGDYTVYLNWKTGIYHANKHCAPCDAEETHLFFVLKTSARPCDRCARNLPWKIPDWFEDPTNNFSR